MKFEGFTQNVCYGNQPQPFEVVFESIDTNTSCSFTKQDLTVEKAYRGLSFCFVLWYEPKFWQLTLVSSAFYGLFLGEITSFYITPIGQIIQFHVTKVFRGLESCIFKKLNLSWKSPYFRVPYHLKSGGVGCNGFYWPFWYTFYAFLCTLIVTVQYFSKFWEHLILFSIECVSKVMKRLRIVSRSFAGLWATMVGLSELSSNSLMQSHLPSRGSQLIFHSRWQKFKTATDLVA